MEPEVSDAGRGRGLATAVVIALAVLLPLVPVIAAVGGSPVLGRLAPALGLVAAALGGLKAVAAGAGALAELLARHRAWAAATSNE